MPATNIYTDEMNFNVGTSFSPPIVAGIAGLMLAVNGNLTSGQLIARLQSGATTPFPVSSDPTVPACHVPTGPSDLQTSECNCATSVCGVGMANAHGAVLQALRPIAAVALPATVTAGANVTLDGSASFDAGGRALTYSWRQTSGPSVTLANSVSAVASFTAPHIAFGGMTQIYTFELTTRNGLAASFDTVTVARWPRHARDAWRV